MLRQDETRVRRPTRGVRNSTAQLVHGLRYHFAAWSPFRVEFILSAYHLQSQDCWCRTTLRISLQSVSANERSQEASIKYSFLDQTNIWPKCGRADVLHFLFQRCR
jgi:hypothetical protein